MKKKTRKLTLSRETLHHLNTPKLTHAIGAFGREIDIYSGGSYCEVCVAESEQHTCNTCPTQNTNCTLWC
jgi:hypothetical protein